MGNEGADGGLSVLLGFVPLKVLKKFCLAAGVSKKEFFRALL